MKKYLLGAASLLVVAAAAIGGYSYYQEQQVDPMIQENLEALTQNEDGEIANPIKRCYNDIHYEVGSVAVWCYTCTPKWDWDDDLFSFASNCRAY